jgi:DNA-binding NarL/FixJ family response regulator
MIGQQEMPMPEKLHAIGAAGAGDAFQRRHDGNRADAGSPHAAPTRVLIAEGQRLVRAGLRVLLERQADMCVAAEAATGEEAVAAALRTRPDVVLIDLALPGLDGVETTRQLLGEPGCGEPRVLMLMSGESDEAVFGALRAGATGLLLKDAEPDALVDAVRVVADGDAPLAPRLARQLVADFVSQPERLRSTPERLEELTPREREVVALVASGLSNEQIAERLVVTRATAKTHVSRALCKLHARDRAQLVVLAYETGLVRSGPRWPEAVQRAVMPARASRIARAPIANGSGTRRLHPVAA